MTPNLVTKLEEAFSIGATVKQACYYANISRQTYYRWMKENPELSDRFDDLREKLPLQALTNIASRIHGKPTLGDINLSRWLLEKRMNDEYGEKIKIEHSTDENDDVLPEDEILEDFHRRLKANLHKRSREKAKEDGEL